MSSNRNLADRFLEAAAILEISGANAFKVNATTKVARILEDLPTEIAPIADDLKALHTSRVLSLDERAEGVLELRVVCQHGTYVKEWISGDEERTSPSLAKLLGVGCHCAVLDVEDILTPGVEGPALEVDEA